MLDEAVRAIDTREELINALIEAAELEHGLLIQYLFAAYSLKRRPEEGISVEQVEKVREWGGAILGVARQEMAHLGTVCNLLTAVGGSPRFGRPNFPQAMEHYYPFDFQLERFTMTTLERFIRFEKPVDEAVEALEGVAPNLPELDRVGELYRQIADGFRTLDLAYARSRQTLFVGPSEAQDADSWTQPIGKGGFNVVPVTDLASALAAIESIVLEGEGAPTDREGSHYDTFLDVHREYQAELAADPDFDPARPVVITPLTRTHRDSGPGPFTLLQEGTPTHDLAELFNHVYSTVLLMLMQFYDYGGETRAQRAGLQASIRQSMSGIIRPIAEVLTELPAGEGIDGTAGPGFELYGELQVPSHLPSRWVVLRERTRVAAAECRRLAQVEDGPLKRLGFIATNLDLLAANIDRFAEGGEGA